MEKQMFIDDLKDIEAFFNRSTKSLTEEDSQFKPKAEIRTVAQTVAHVAITIDWFMDGAFGKDGFKMDFEDQEKRAHEYTSLTEARKCFSQSIKNATDILSNVTDEELSMPLNDKEIFGPRPRWTIIPYIAEHTAHTRGILTVYARLLNKIPANPYSDM